MSGRQPTTPEKVNFCSCGAATSAGIMKVAGHDWIKNDYIIHDVPCPLIIDTKTIESL